MWRLILIFSGTMLAYDRQRPAAVIECPFTTQQLMSPESIAQVPVSEFSSAQLCIIPDDGKAKEQLYVKAPSFCGRRAMVNNLWYRKISRVWLQTKFELPHPRVFSEPRCRTYVTFWYLIYRWMISLFWMMIIICSLGEFGSAKPRKNLKTWPIYLTNWDLVLGLIQSVLGAFLVTKRWSLQNNQNSFDPCHIIHGKLEKLYWVLYTVTCTLAVGVTVSYWVLVHDPKIHQVDPLNIMLHVCNSLLMLADVCVSNVPLEFRYFWWCLVLIMFYLMFTLIYFAAGGLDKNGYHYIYKSLDWKKPGATILIASGVMIFLIIVHCLFCYITKLLDKLFKSGAKYMDESSLSSTNEQTLKSKDLEIV